MTWATGRRLLAQWRLKALLCILMTGAFATGYLCLQRFPLFDVAPAPQLALDRRIPFLPGSVWVYESLWLAMPVGPWLMTTSSELWRCARSAAAVMAVAFLVFLFLPTSCPRPEGVQTNALYRALVRFDGENNAFPSLHVAFAVLGAAWFSAALPDGRWRALLRCCVWAWAGTIVLSTLLTRQHVIVDVAGGLVLGAAGCFLFHLDPGGSDHR